MIIDNKILQLIKLKQQIIDIECNLHTLKQNNTKSSFEYAKIKMTQLKELKSKFQQTEQELHDLLDKIGSDIFDKNSIKKNI